MVIRRGEERGYIKDRDVLKVHVAKESPWVKVVAMHKSKKKLIGILQNNLFTTDKYKWGDLVLVVERKPNEIAEIIQKVSSVPNNPSWSTDF